MLALEVGYLTDRSVACERNDRDTAEWPPHPGRLFMALVAAHAERDAGDAAERAALIWLENQKPPQISASEASRRDVVDAFVPVNDNFGPDKVPKGGFTASLIAQKLRVLPERRSKQARTFPSVTPESPFVFFIWPDADAEELSTHIPALERLAANVTYLGHSSSLVSVAVRHDPPPPTLIPSDEGTHVLRVPTRGRLDDLLASYKSQRRPSMGYSCSYAEASVPASVPQSVFGSVLTFKLIDPALPLIAAARLTSAARMAGMKKSDIQPAPEILSGHTADNAPSQRDHVAYFPLAFVDHRFADGIVRGIGAAIPRDLASHERTLVVRALAQIEMLWLGSDGEWSVERIVGEPQTKSLDPSPYVRASRSWATVTPMVFDQFPKNRPGRDAAAVIGRACRRIGLPEPVAIDISHVSRLRGVPTSVEFKIVPKSGVPARPYAHASLLFDRPVRGPVILGAGRYQGLGLFRAVGSHPVDSGKENIL